MADLSEIAFYLSGGSIGSGNTDTTKSTGGVITTTKILSQAAVSSTTGTTASTISGVTLGDAAGNALGDGTLTFTYSASGSTLQWTPYSGSVGPAVDVSTSGTYALSGGNFGGVLNVTVVAASLPTANKTDTITVTAQALKIFDTVTKAQAKAGLTEYRCIYVKNNGTTLTTDDKVDLEFFISSNTPGADTISMGLATQVAGTGTGVSGTDYPADTTSETGVPAGVTFSSPTSTSPLTAFTLSSTAGTTYARGIWFKREVPAGTYTETLGNAFTIGFNVKV